MLNSQDKTTTNHLMANLYSLAIHNNVQGEVIRVEDDPAVATAYDLRGNNYDDQNSARAVAEAIKQVILNHWDNSNGMLHYLILVGDDRVIPFYRITDGTHHPDPMILTDDFYLDHPPYNVCTDCANPQLFVPDIAGGRLVESPSPMRWMIQTFISKPNLYLNNAIVVGGALGIDLTPSHCEVLQKDNISTECILTSQTWSAQDFKQYVFGVQHDVTAIALNADYNFYQTPTGERVSPTDLFNAPTDFAGRLVYSLGCHVGQNLASDLDWPTAYAIKQAYSIGNTGFAWKGYGMILSEKLMHRFFEELTAKSVTLGTALMQAKQSYLAEVPNPNQYDEKIIAENTLYGLPMYLVQSPPDPRRATDQNVRRSLRTSTLLPGGAEKTSLSYEWPLPSPVVTAQGSFYALQGEVTSDDNAPILPRLTDDVTHSDKALHGLVFRGGHYTQINTAPPLQRFTTISGYPTPEQTFVSPGWYPSQFFTAHTLKLHTGDKHTLVATVGQYNPNLSHGTQRIFDTMNFDVYYHTADDWTRPEVDVTESQLQNHLAMVRVTASDAEGIAEIVIAYTDGQTLWNSVDLTSSGTTWEGSFAANSDTEFFVQAVDNSGNVTVNDNHGQYFKFDDVPMLPVLSPGFTGGTSVKDQTHQSQTVFNLSDPVEVTGHIAVHASDVGKTADIFVYAEATFPFSSEIYYFMLGENLEILLWDKEPAHLVPFKQVTLEPTQSVSIYQGTFYYPGTLKVYFGYRLADGTVVANEQPIDITILP